MKITIISAFPNSFSFLKESIPMRAQKKNRVQINYLNLIDFGKGKWNKIDDRPYGGGEGMLLQVEPIYKALKSLGVYPERDKKTKVVMTSARGKEWTQDKAEKYASKIEHLIIICGHYEGIDYRVVEEFIDEEISIGKYILSGGELAAMAISDSIIRLLPEVLGNEVSKEKETTFKDDYKLAEHPQYTRPAIFKTKEGKELMVPDILLSGDHKELEAWKKKNTKRKAY